MHGWSTKRITYTGMFVAIAMVFSYLESMIPVNIAVPGIKLGLANMVTIGSSSHEEWQYHVVYAGAVHIGNYSRCVHRPGGGCACQKASVHRILE